MKNQRAATSVRVRPLPMAFGRGRARRARFIPGLEQVLQGRFADAGHKVGPSVGVTAFRVVGRAGRPDAPVLLAGRRQEIAETQRKVLQAYLPIAVPVQVGEYHVRVAVADLELGAQLAELVRADPALAVPVALVEQVLQMDVAHGRSVYSLSERRFNRRRDHRVTRNARSTAIHGDP